MENGIVDLKEKSEYFVDYMLLNWKESELIAILEDFEKSKYKKLHKDRKKEIEAILKDFDLKYSQRDKIAIYVKQHLMYYVLQGFHTIMKKIE